jgi:hypothetical protein
MSFRSRLLTVSPSLQASQKSPCTFMQKKQAKHTTEDCNHCATDALWAQGAMTCKRCQVEFKS